MTAEFLTDLRYMQTLKEQDMDPSKRKSRVHMHHEALFDAVSDARRKPKEIARSFRVPVNQIYRLRAQIRKEL